MALDRNLDLAIATLIFDEIQPEGYKWGETGEEYVSWEVAECPLTGDTYLDVAVWPPAYSSDLGLAFSALEKVHQDYKLVAAHTIKIDGIRTKNLYSLYENTSKHKGDYALEDLAEAVCNLALSVSVAAEA